MADEKTTGINFGEEYDTKDFGVIDDGVYEVTIEDIQPKVSTKGNKYLNLKLRIRTDVEQKFRNRVLFYTITQTNKDDACYDHKKVNRIILTQKTKPTYKTNFETFDEVIQYMIGINFSLAVSTQFDDFRNEDVNVIDESSIAPSEWDKVAHAPANGGVVANNIQELPDDDLPF